MAARLRGVHRALVIMVVVVLGEDVLGEAGGDGPTARLDLSSLPKPPYPREDNHSDESAPQPDGGDSGAEEEEEGTMGGGNVGEDEGEPTGVGADDAQEEGLVVAEAGAGTAGDDAGTDASMDLEVIEGGPEDAVADVDGELGKVQNGTASVESNATEESGEEIGRMKSINEYTQDVLKMREDLKQKIEEERVQVDGEGEGGDEMMGEEGAVGLDKTVLDYASFDSGGKVLAHSPKTTGAHNVIVAAKDSYMMTPCSEKKWIVIALSEEIRVDSVTLAHYEFYSSTTRRFQVLATREYPPKPGTKLPWAVLGDFIATVTHGEQTFKIDDPFWARFIKLRFLEHHGSEHFCTVSRVSVHGKTIIEDLRNQIDESDQDVSHVISVISSQNNATKTAAAAAAAAGSTVGGNGAGVTGGAAAGGGESKNTTGTAVTSLVAVLPHDDPRAPEDDDRGFCPDLSPMRTAFQAFEDRFEESTADDEAETSREREAESSGNVLLKVNNKVNKLEITQNIVNAYLEEMNTKYSDALERFGRRIQGYAEDNDATKSLVYSNVRNIKEMADRNKEWLDDIREDIGRQIQALLTVVEKEERKLDGYVRDLEDRLDIAIQLVTVATVMAICALLCPDVLRAVRVGLFRAVAFVLCCRCCCRGRSAKHPPAQPRSQPPIQHYFGPGAAITHDRSVVHRRSRTNDRNTSSEREGGSVTHRGGRAAVAGVRKEKKHKQHRSLSKSDCGALSRSISLDSISNQASAPSSVKAAGPHSVQPQVQPQTSASGTPRASPVPYSIANFQKLEHEHKTKISPVRSTAYVQSNHLRPPLAALGGQGGTEGGMDAGGKGGAAVATEGRGAGFLNKVRKKKV